MIQSARITGHTRQYRESGFVLVPHTDVSAYQNVATCANGRFDGPHYSIKNVGRMAAMGRETLAKEVSSDRNTACISGLTHTNMDHSALAEGLP